MLHIKTVSISMWLALLIGLAFYLAVQMSGQDAGKSFHVQTVEPVKATVFAPQNSYVIKLSGAIFTCPLAKNVSMYVRPEVGAVQAFIYIPPRKIVREDAKTKLTVACLRIE